MLAEGIHEKDHLIHPNRDLLVSDFWGSYFYYPRTPLTKQIAKVSSFRKLSASVIANSTTSGCCSFSGRTTPGPSGLAGTATAAGLRRVSSLRNSEDLKKTDKPFHRKNSVTVSAAMEINQATAEAEIEPAIVGPMKINTLWGTLIRDHARMCIPDLECLVEYPLDYQFPAFAWSKKGSILLYFLRKFFAYFVIDQYHTIFRFRSNDIQWILAR